MRNLAIIYQDADFIMESPVVIPGDVAGRSYRRAYLVRVSSPDGYLSQDWVCDASKSKLATHEIATALSLLMKVNHCHDTHLQTLGFEIVRGDRTAIAAWLDRAWALIHGDRT